MKISLTVATYLSCYCPLFVAGCTRVKCKPSVLRAIESACHLSLNSFGSSVCAATMNVSYVYRLMSLYPLACRLLFGIYIIEWFNFGPRRSVSVHSGAKMIDWTFHRATGINRTNRRKQYSIGLWQATCSSVLWKVRPNYSIPSTRVRL